MINNNSKSTFNKNQLTNFDLLIDISKRFRGIGTYCGLDKIDLYDEGIYLEDTMTQYEFFKYYFTPTEYIDVENLVDVDTIRI